MEIGSIHTHVEDSVTPPTACRVCGNQFQPAYDLQFVCRNCQAALVGHCPECMGKYDDIHIDWGVDTDAGAPYFWIIECVCGYELQSRPCSSIEMDEVAQQLHMQFTCQ